MVSNRFNKMTEIKRITRQDLRPMKESAKRIYCCKCCRYIGNKYGENDAEFDRDHFKIDPYPRNTENLTGERYSKYLCPFCEEQYKKHQNWKGTNHDFDEDKEVKKIFTENINGVCNHNFRKHIKEDLTLFDDELGIDENYSVWKYVDQDTLRKTFDIISIIDNDINRSNINRFIEVEDIKLNLSDMNKGLEIVADSYDMETLRQGLEVFEQAFDMFPDFINTFEEGDDLKETHCLSIDGFIKKNSHLVNTFDTFEYVLKDTQKYGRGSYNDSLKAELDGISEDRKIKSEFATLLRMRQLLLIWYKCQLMIEKRDK